MVQPTKRIRAIKQAYNTNPNAWGGLLNDGGLEMLDEGFGVSTVEVNADVVLQKEDYIEDDARRLGLILFGDGGFEITSPAVDKPYLVFNGCDDDVTLTPEGGTGAVIRAGSMVWWMTDGEVSFVSDPGINDLKPPTSPVDFNAQRLANIGEGINSTDAATKGQLDAIAGSADAAQEAAEAAEEALDAINSKFTISTQPPSGGNDGDVWFRIA